MAQIVILWSLHDEIQNLVIIEHLTPEEILKDKNKSKKE